MKDAAILKLFAAETPDVTAAHKYTVYKYGARVYTSCFTSRGCASPSLEKNMYSQECNTLRAENMQLQARCRK